MDVREQLQSTLGGAYTLERELGGGGMSRVFVADETRLGRKVVVKVLSPELAAGISAERFEREIKLAASLQQANIVPVLSAGEANGMPYYTMPLVDGESLRARLARGPLTIGEVTSILRDVARALAYAHDRGIVHRDIKPDNVLLSRGTAVVTDFGIAKALAAASSLPRGATLTQMGTALGTPLYMAPEQAAGDPDTDHRADIYAFGCMAYELLSGRPPFDASTPQRLLAAHMAETARPVNELRVDTPAELTALVTRCMEKQPSDRPQSGDELLAVLDAATTSDAAQRPMPAILLGGRGMLKKALGAYAVAFIVVAVLAKAAIVGIGLPDWVFPGALIVMALGLPVILFTAYTQYVAHRAILASPTFTPGGTPAPAMRGTMATMAIKASPHMSWRRTTMFGAYAVGAFVLLVGAFMTLRALGIGPAGSLLAAGRMTDRDRVIVTDFAVKGADSTLSSVVSEAVRTSLAQSNVINVLNPTTVAAALRRMQRPATTRVDLALAREIGQREGAKAVVDGDITPVGAGFVMSMRLVTSDSGIELASFHETADGLKDLLPTLDKLTRDLRGRMGESLKLVQAEPPLEEYTTSSLEALRKLAEGRRANNIDGDAAKSVRLLQEAVALDSTFAMAWRALGLVEGNLSYPQEQIDSAFTKAYRYRDRLTERERLLVTIDYFGRTARDRARAVAAYHAYLDRYPHDYAVLSNLASAYRQRRQYATADSLFRRGIAENPDAVLLYTNLYGTLVDEGRIADAKALAVEIHKRFANSPIVDGGDALALLAEGKRDSAFHIVDSTKTSRFAAARVRAYNLLTSIAASRGQLHSAEQYQARVTQETAAAGSATSPFELTLDSAFNRAWFLEQGPAAATMLDAAIARHPFRTLTRDQARYFDVATVYALAGRPDRARATIAEYDARVRDTTVRRGDEPDRHTLLGELALAEHKPQDALVEFRKGDSLPDGPADNCPRCTLARLARAYDLAGKSDSAIVSFERYLNTPSNNGWWRDADPMNLAGTYKRLGELYEAKGQTQRAASNYMKFVDLWKNADPELQPKVAEVKKRLARLSDTERKQ